MSTITRGTITVTPTVVVGAAFGSVVPTIQHVLIDGTVRYTLRPALPRTGTLGMVFSTEATAIQAFNLHRASGPLTYVEPDMPTAGMTYLVNGEVKLELDPETAAVWILTVPYLEAV